MVDMLIDPETGEELPSPKEPVECTWPTGKPHISFSELSNWVQCSYRHKLLYIDQLGTFSYTPHLSFGTAVHDAIENYLKTGKMDKAAAEKMIRESWEENKELFLEGPFPDWAPKGYGKVEDWIAKSVRILNDAPEWITKQFPGYEVISAEEQLYEPIEGQPIKFKGFIDAILKVPTKKEGKFLYWIIDWKTCSWGWNKYKKEDFNVQLQLILYKSFWSRKHNIPMKDIRCGFGLLMRDPSKKARYALDILPVSVGEKTESKGLKVINNHVRSVKMGMFLKNRESCRFCDFENTEHCKPNL